MTSTDQSFMGALCQFPVCVKYWGFAWTWDIGAKYVAKPTWTNSETDSRDCPCQFLSYVSVGFISPHFFLEHQNSGFL